MPAKHSFVSDFLLILFRSPFNMSWEVSTHSRNTKMLWAVLLAAIYLTLSAQEAAGDCCYPIWRCGEQMEPNFGFWRGCCHDGRRPSNNGTGWIYCGITSCNIFGCGCPCRERPLNWVSLLPMYAGEDHE